MAEKSNAVKNNEFMGGAELKEVRRAFSHIRDSKTLRPAASALERAKNELCRQLIVYMREHDIFQRQLVKLLGVSESRVSEIVHYNIGKITLDRLVELHEVIDNEVTLKVA